MLDRIVNDGRCLCSTIVALVKAKLSQCLVHVQNVRELTQARAISLLTDTPFTPPRGSVTLSQLVDEIDDDRTSGWRHDDVGGSEIPMDDSGTVQSTDPGSNSFDDLAACRDGTQVGRSNFRVEGTPRHIVVDDCPAAIV